MSLSLKFLTVPATIKHTATVICIHGLGDTGHGWESLAQMFRRDPALQHIKWILPHSPIRPVTANSGMTMPSWFDIYSFDFESAEDEAGMLNSSRQINELISAEVDAGVNAGRIMLVGFSQGGAMALLTGLICERKLGGIAGLSTWLPLRKKIKSMVSQHASAIPIFWGYGDNDSLINASLYRASVDHLTNVCGIPMASDGSVQGLKVQIYPGMAHTSSPRELDDLKDWLKSTVPKEI